MLKGIVSGSPVDITRIAMKGKNLFDKSTITTGYYATMSGANANSSYYCSDFIPITAVTYYFQNVVGGSYQNTVVVYDANKQGLRYVKLTGSAKVSGAITFQSGDAYIRINCYYQTDVDTVMVNIGNSALPYEPYGIHEGWEVRDQQGRIIWGADKTLTGTDSITYKGYGLDIKEYDIDGNMVQAAEKEYSISGQSPLDFQSNGSNATISISGNETQASNQAYTTSGTSPLSFNADGTNLTALSMDGNMNQASSQPYTVSGTSPISFMNNGTAIDYTVSGNMNQTGTPTPPSPITPEETGDRTVNLASGTSNIDTIVNGVKVKSDSYGTFTVSGEAVSSGGRGVPISGTILLKAGTYSISTGSTITASLCISNADNNAFIVSATSESTFTLYSDTNIKFGLNFVSGQNYDESFTIMLNTGSTAQPYEPFGYKIPITNGSTTYNIYLSEPLRKIGDYADTINSDGTVTRKVYRFKVTQASNTNNFENAFTVDVPKGAAIQTIISNIAVSTDSLPVYADRGGKVFLNSAKVYIGFGAASDFPVAYTNHNPTAQEIAVFNDFVSSHDVYVWYVLETPETETVTTPTITPTSGNNTLSVDTTLAPSNITITSNSSVFPGNPIIPIECGVKTDNLFPLDATKLHVGRIETDGTIGYEVGTITAGTNSITYQADTTWRGFYTDFIQANENEMLTISPNDSSTLAWSCSCYDKNDNFLGRATAQSTASTRVFSPLTGTKKVRISITSSNATYTITNPMLNIGSSALPYEPYGKYKIPITNAGTTYNVYLTEPLRKIGDYADVVNSDGTVTRRIKKVVFTGQETWTEVYPGEPEAQAQGIVMYATSLSEIGTDRNDFMCSHFFVGNYRGYLISGQGRLNGTSPEAFNLNYNNGSGGLQNFKEWLASEYAACHPVTLWYVLSTPDTTETTTIPTISTVNGANTLTTGTPITPSNITISTSSSVYPKNPIYPEECGDKTANLFDKSQTTGIVSGKYINQNGELISDTYYYLSYPIKLTIGETYTWSFSSDTQKHNAPTVGFYDSEDNLLSVVSHSSNIFHFSFTIPQGCAYIRASVYKREAVYTFDPMLIIGTVEQADNVPLNWYEPYGYKIPITIGSNTNYIYTKEPIRKIGDYADVVNSDGTVTRRIKKLVFDGTENVSYNARNDTTERFAVTIPASGGTTTPENVISTHFNTVPVTTYPLSVGGICMRSTGNDVVLGTTYDIIGVTSPSTQSVITTATKRWLADEYTEGHPVTVWYVLTTPVSDTATFPTITTASGSNTLSVNTTLAPSSITLTTTSGVWSKNPIEPEEFGDKTANLFDGVWEIGNISSSGEMTDINYHVRSSNYTDVSGLSYISVTFSRTFTSVRICEYDDTKTFLQRSAYETSSVTHQLMPETKYIKLVINDGMAQFPDVTSPDYHTMLVSGQTALPYEPYGKYKIPITNASTTYNIYMTEPLRKIGDYADSVDNDGMVTRRIKKVVVTSDKIRGFNSELHRIGVYITASVSSDAAICSHYMVQVKSDGSFAHMYIGSNNTYIYIFDPSFVTQTDAEDFLNAQYAAGTPVSVWYVLNTPTAETVTAPEIATTVGTNILTVDTTLVPSKTTITGHIKPIHFGFKIDKTNDNSDTAVTYTHDAITMTPAVMNFTTGEFNYGSWENVWFVKNAYPVALNLDGTEAYKLNPDDYTKKDDGTDSDIQFVLLTEAPSDWSTQWKQYYTKDANDNYELNSQSSAPTFAQDTYYKLTYNSSFTGNFMMAFPKVWFYRHEDSQYNYIEISNYKLSDDWKCYAHVNASGQEVDFIYLPLFKGVIKDSKLRSLPGQIPQGNTTATDEVNAATALGSRWQIWDHSSVELINDLLVLMSKSIDSQGKFGKGRESGYDSSDTVTYGKLQTGTLVKGGKFKGFSSSYKEVKVFGIEGFWANRWDRLQGMLLVDNVWKIKMTPPYNFTGTDFVTLSSASVPSGNGYLSKVQTSQYGSIPASIEGGASSKFYKDYFYKTATSTRVAIRGGTCGSGASCGFRYVHLNSAASYSAWSFGASPVYK